jgi:hypothetical protein
MTLPPNPYRTELRVFLLATLIAAPIAALFALVAMKQPMVLLVFPAAIAVAGFLVVAARPVLAAYLFLAFQPIIGGIDRGAITPIVRPSEALQGFLLAAVIFGALRRAWRGERLTIHITRFDRALIGLAVLGSLWPWFWMLARGSTPSMGDVSWSVVVWRLAALYAMFRWVVRTPKQVRTCLWIVLFVASFVAIIAISQALTGFRIGGPWTITEGSGETLGRGGATLNSPIATGDFLAYSMGIALVWFFRHREPRRLIAACGVVILAGALGTGQFSAWFALLIIGGFIVIYEGQFRHLVGWFVPIGAVCAIIAWPVITTRLAGFGSGFGIPPSWLGRIDNLTNFYIPQMSGFRWVLGVRPDPVLNAPETWRQTIYLESGYLYFFWAGGIPLFLGFLWWLRNAFRMTARVARARTDDIGVAALAARGALLALTVLTVIDMHLTMRGGADLLFALLGLTAILHIPVATCDTDHPKAIPLPSAAERALERNVR